MKAPFLGLLGVRQGANDYAVGAPDGVEAARVIELEPNESAWDEELLLSMNWLSWDGTRPDDQGQHVENTVANKNSFCRQSLEQEEMEGKEDFLATDGCTSERTSRSGSTVELRDVKVVMQTPQSNRTTSRSCECWKRVQSAMRDEPNVLRNPRDT